MSVSTPTAPVHTSRRSRLLGWAGVGTLAAAFATSLTIAVWPASQADKARDDGEQMGAAVSALSTAQDPGEVGAALTDLEVAVSVTRDHAGERFNEQLSETEDALVHAADGFVAAHTTGGWDAERYQAELDAALVDLEDQAQDIRADAPELVQAFWDGFDSMLATA